MPVFENPCLLTAFAHSTMHSRPAPPRLNPCQRLVRSFIVHCFTSFLLPLFRRLYDTADAANQLRALHQLPAGTLGRGVADLLLAHELDGNLLRALAEFPRVVTAAAELREPHRVARYLEDTAAVFNKWYDTKECRMLPQGDEPVTPVNEARLTLVSATRTVLANGLGLLGVSAPERM